MKIRKKLATLALLAATLTATLGATLMAGSASADHYSDHVFARRHSVVGTGWDGSQFHLDTRADLYRSSGYLYVTTYSWTTGWFGFHGCVEVTYRNAGGERLGSLFQMAGTTGINGQVRTVPSSMYIGPVAHQVASLEISQWHCPR